MRKNELKILQRVTSELIRMYISYEEQEISTPDGNRIEAIIGSAEDLIIQTRKALEGKP